MTMMRPIYALNMTLLLYSWPCVEKTLTRFGDWGMYLHNVKVYNQMPTKYHGCNIWFFNATLYDSSCQFDWIHKDICIHIYRYIHITNLNSSTPVNCTYDNHINNFLWMSSAQTCCIIPHAITVNWKLPWCQLCPQWWHQIVIMNKITSTLSLIGKIYLSSSKELYTSSNYDLVRLQLRLIYDLVLLRPSHSCFEHVQNFSPSFLCSRSHKI